ncbi:MAG: hypothetical protein MUF71_14185 [Candidatus Kapabacteria bacterium]|nr:hypothetical protein [Candidatus Kapabacteria bacterium]
MKTIFSSARFIVSMIPAICVMMLTLAPTLFAQLYVDSANARYRFAQMYVGVDMQIQPSGGDLVYQGLNGSVSRAQMDTRIAPRVTVGGMHFWGHTDFFITISPFQTSTRFTDAAGNSVNAMYQAGVETGARVYPWRVERDKIRPFVGIAWQPGMYRQTVNGEDGASLNLDRTTLSAGATFQTGDVIIEGGARWMFNMNDMEYYAGRSEKTTMTLPSAAFWLGAKYVFDTTVDMEERDKRGGLERHKKYFEKKGAMNTFTIAIGPSSVWTASPSPHNEAKYPFLNPRNAVVVADIGVGYYLHDIDAHLNFAVRSMNSSQRAFGLEQQLTRTTIGLEGYKYFFDYHGFMPFLGAGIGVDFLSATQRDRSEDAVRAAETKFLPYVITGWDIRPSGVEWFLLRTNVRYTPNVTLTMPNTGSALRLQDLEINFIQLVININRFLALR